MPEGELKEVTADKLAVQQRIASVGDDHEWYLSKFKDRVDCSNCPTNHHHYLISHHHSYTSLLEQLVLHLAVQVQDQSGRHAHVVNALRRFKVDPFTDELFAAFQVSHRQQLDGKTKNIAHLSYCKMD
ncbi:hypothetical protein ZWY2020_029020 [Hordeum vulgare]|nr:hypothetical protein ZWY2020_029020 [Hordeum vulgare]